MANPCLSCGACCAHFRVSFYWSESDPFLGGVVPQELTVPINQYYVAMKGTECAPARCNALDGNIGENVSCSIYEQRPSACREVMYSGYNNTRDEKCDKARIAHGLPPLTPDNTPGKPVFPKVA